MLPPDNIQSLDYNNIPSEAIALNCAFAAGIIADFLEDGAIVPTVSGRMDTGVFNFTIHDIENDTLRSVSVANAQMEIDAAYEGHSCLAILEAKLALSEDFIIRQIYYPFRVWRNRLTRPVRLIRHKNYSVDDITITAQDVQNILRSIPIVREPEGIPLPQADR